MCRANVLKVLVVAALSKFKYFVVNFYYLLVLTNKTMIFHDVMVRILFTYLFTCPHQNM